MKRLLLVEDEPGLVLTLTDRLTAEGYTVTSTGDGNAAVDRALRETYDIVVLDVMLPGRDGFEVCRAVRQGGVRAPILMLTARGQLVDRVVGLKLGADDYLVKPFEMAELLARLEALLRRRLAGIPGGRSIPVWRRRHRHAPDRSTRHGASSSSPRSSSSCCAISSSMEARRCHATSC